MNDLFNLKLVETDGDQFRAVNARDLHTFLEVGRDFSTWIKDRIDQYGFIDGIDYVFFPKFSEKTKNSFKNDSPNLGNQKIRGGDRRSKEYALSLDMAKELSMVENNEQGRIARRYFIECEKRLAIVAPKQHQIAGDNWRKARIDTRDYQKIMCAALAFSRERQGKETSANHYTNESNMLYGLLFGTTAKKWLLSEALTGEVRQHLSADQLERLAYLERTNTALLDMDMSYEARKQILSDLFKRYKNKGYTSDV